METPTRRITVTSSLNRISTDLLQNRVAVRGGQAFGQIFKDDVNGFSSTSDISFMHCTLPAINEARKPAMRHHY
jgi:hypothetical protein